MRMYEMAHGGMWRRMNPTTGEAYWQSDFGLAHPRMRMTMDQVVEVLREAEGTGWAGMDLIIHQVKGE